MKRVSMMDSWLSRKYIGVWRRESTWIKNIMTKFVVTATTKIANITAKTIPVALLFTRSPKRIKSEDKVIFFIDIAYGSSSREENHKDEEGREKREVTSSILQWRWHLREHWLGWNFPRQNAREKWTDQEIYHKSEMVDLFFFVGEQHSLYYVYAAIHRLCKYHNKIGICYTSISV